MSVIEPSPSLVPSPYPNMRVLHTMSDTHLVALEQQASGTLKYRISADGGSTWGSAASVGGTAGCTLNHCFAAQVIGADVLHIWYTDPSDAAIDARLVKVSGYTGTAFTTSTTLSYFPLLAGGGGASDAAYDGSSGLWHVVKGRNSRTGAAGVFATDGSGSVAAFATAGAINIRLASWDCVALCPVPGMTPTICVLVGANDLSQTYLLPLYYTGSYLPFSMGATETVPFGAPAAWAWMGLDSFSRLDIVTDLGSGGLYTTRRSAANAYLSPTFLVDTDTEGWQTNRDNAGALSVFYANRAAEANGEVYQRKRTASSSSFTPGRMVAGGDAAGYVYPRSAAVSDASGDIPLAYLSGSSLDFVDLGASAAPSKPVDLTPDGYTDTLTPTLRAPYVNTVPTDLQKSLQVQVYQSDGTTLVWDSTEVVTANPYLLYAGTALVYATTYKWQIRYKDSLSAGGSGTWSTWSDQATLTPVHAPAVTLTSIAAVGSTSSSSPATLGSNSITDAVIAYTQADSNHGDHWYAEFYLADGITLKDATGQGAISPTLASGASFTSPPWTALGLTNGLTGKLRVGIRDAVTQITGWSSFWDYTTSWVPGSPGTLLTFGVDNNAGVAAATWTNPGGAAGVLTEWSDAGLSDWTTLKPLGLYTFFTNYDAPVYVAKDYRITWYDASGIASTPIVITAADMGTLQGAHDDDYPVWLNAESDPAGLSVFLGPLDDWASGTGWNQPTLEPQAWQPAGWTEELSDYRLSDTLKFQRRFKIPKRWVSGATGDVIEGWPHVQLLRAFAKAKTYLRCRDQDGLVISVRIANVTWNTADGNADYSVQFDISTVRQLAQPLCL